MSLGFTCLVVSALLIVQSYGDCSDHEDCASCSQSWDCVWCVRTGLNQTSDCVSGNFFLGHGCDNWHYKWRQCSFAGWILVLIVFGGAVLFVGVLICLCCCCCARRRRRRRAVAYSQLDEPVRSAPIETPKTDEWRIKMSEKYGISTQKSAPQGYSPY